MSIPPQRSALQFGVYRSCSGWSRVDGQTLTDIDWPASRQVIADACSRWLECQSSRGGLPHHPLEWGGLALPQPALRGDRCWRLTRSSRSIPRRLARTLHLSPSGSGGRRVPATLIRRRLAALAIMRLTRLSIEMEGLLDCRDPVTMGLTLDDLLHDTDYRLTQQIGAASVALGIEGILVPSATLLGDNLVVWTSQLRSTLANRRGSSEDPRVYVPPLSTLRPT